MINYRKMINCYKAHRKNWGIFKSIECTFIVIKMHFKSWIKLNINPQKYRQWMKNNLVDNSCDDIIDEMVKAFWEK